MLDPLRPLCADVRLMVLRLLTALRTLMLSPISTPMLADKICGSKDAVERIVFDLAV